MIEAVKRCPSGALSYSVGSIEETDEAREPTITVSKNGPYYVTGAFSSQAPRGARRDRGSASPSAAAAGRETSDGTHWSIGFADEPD